VEGVDRAYNMADVTKYVKDVFGLDLIIPEDYYHAGYVEGDLYYVLGSQFSNGDRVILDEIDVRNGEYAVKGSIAFGEKYGYGTNSSTPTYYETNRFALSLVKNDESPFGFTVTRLTFEDTTPTEFMGTEYQYRVLLQMKQAMDEYEIKHPQQHVEDIAEKPADDVKDVDYEKVDEQ
jgi:hypothetical protein